MLVLEVMSLFMLGLLGAALPAGGSDDDDEDRAEDDSADSSAPAPAALEEDEPEGEGASLLDFAVADDAPPTSDASGGQADKSADDPWLQEEQDAVVEAELDMPEDEAETGAELDVLAAIARLTAATPPAGSEDDDTAEEGTGAAGWALASLAPEAPDDSEVDESAANLDEDEDEAAAGPAEDWPATTIADYQPGVDQIEITIFAPPPDTAVDVVLQQTPDGTGTEVLIEGKLQAVLAGVLPGDVDANDLYIEFAG